MNAEVDIKLGKGIGDFFVRNLQDAQNRIWIMSPWVSTEYMDLAIAKKNLGLDVRVTTSNNWVPGQKEAVNKLLEKKVKITRPENKYLKYIGAALFAGALIFFFKDPNWMAFFTGIAGVVLISFGIEKTGNYWISRLGLSKLNEENLVVLKHYPWNTVHAKIYLVDDTIMIGSANLTGNGTHRNTEAMVTIKNNKELIDSLIKSMKNIKEISGLPSVSFDELGRQIEYVAPEKNYHHHYYRRHR